MNEDLYTAICQKAADYSLAYSRQPTKVFVDAKTLMQMYRPGPSPFGTELCRYGTVDGMTVYEARDRFNHGPHPTILEVA